MEIIPLKTLVLFWVPSRDQKPVGEREASQAPLSPLSPLLVSLRDVLVLVGKVNTEG